MAGKLGELGDDIHGPFRVRTLKSNINLKAFQVGTDAPDPLNIRRRWYVQVRAKGAEIANDEFACNVQMFE